MVMRAGYRKILLDLRNNYYKECQNVLSEIAIEIMLVLNRNKHFS